MSFNFMAAVSICSDFGAPKNKVWHCFHFFPIYSPWSAFWMLSFKPTFSLSSFTFIKRLFSSSSLSAVRVVSFYSGMRDSNVWDGGYSISLQRNSDPEWTNNRSKKIAFVWRTEIWRIVVNIALPDLSWYFLTLVYRMLSLLLFNLTFIIKRKEKCVGI